MTSPPPTNSKNPNSLDDIFGSSPPYEDSQPLPKKQETESSIEPSELPSLRRQHVTAGYRDGISASKAEHVQQGFDAGFPVGAQLGMRAGTVLGIIEGVLRGYEGRAGSGVVKKQPGPSARAMQETEADQERRRERREQILRMYREAVKELNVQAVFAGLDGGGDGEEKPETQLGRKGDTVVSKWERRVQVAHWEENMDELERKDEGATATKTE